MYTASVRVIKRKGDVTIKTYRCADPAYAITHVLLDERVIKALKGRECDVEMAQESTTKFQSLLPAAPTPTTKAKAKSKK
jgi:hypothetical protein